MGYSDLVNQLHRASASVSLNIAEGAGRFSINDKRRCYSIARGSALECAAIIEILSALGLVAEDRVTKLNLTLEEIAGMLGALVFKFGRDRAHSGKERG